jgi:hypothetical protein
MLPAHLLTATVTLVYEQAGNSYNSSAPAKPNVDVRAYFRPRRSNTVVNGGELLTADYSIMLNWDVDVEGLAGVIVNGEMFALDGPPMPHWNPVQGSVEYVRIDLRQGAM